MTASADIPESQLRIAEAERELRVRLQVAADAAMKRALEKGGAKLRSIAQRDRSAKTAIAASGVTNDALISQFPDLVASLEQTPDGLIGDSFVQFADFWDREVQNAQYQLIEMLTNGLTAAGLDGTQQSQAKTEFDEEIGRAS